LPFPEYDQEFNHTLRIDQACENILALHKLAVENPDILINDINHNYQINKSRFESDTKLVADTLKKFEYYGEVFDVIPTHDSITDEKSTEYYEEIKL
jgi:hypothetical protein